MGTDSRGGGQFANYLMNNDVETDNFIVRISSSLEENVPFDVIRCEIIL